MPDTHVELATLKAIIAGRFPDLAASRFVLLSEGWDSVAVDVDDRLIFKFPRHAAGEAALRREVDLLDLVRPAVTMPVPSLTLYDAPQTFSRHEKIAGEHLLAEHYAQLGEDARQALGEALGQFYAEMHTIGSEQAIAAGALPAYQWLGADDILRLACPMLPEALLPFAQDTMERWRTLEPDPYGLIYGFFDGHGWNMAFDHVAGRLNGVYDFADSGIGPLHQEFIYSNMISPDLTARIITSYESHTGRFIDRDRVDLLTSTHRLWELAAEAHLPHGSTMVEGVLAWVKARG